MVREAQLKEKDKKKKEKQEEEERFNKMADLERRKWMIIEEEVEKRKKEERMLGALQIMEQIKHNEQVGKISIFFIIIIILILVYPISLCCFLRKF